MRAEGVLKTVRQRIASKARLAKGTALSVTLAAVALGAAACSSGPSASQSANQLLAAGLAAQKAQNYAVAVSDYNQVLQKQPNNKYAFYNRGLIEQLQNQNAAAEKDYRSAIAIDPNFAAALYNLAIIVTASNPAQAESYYLQVIQLQPGNSSAHLNLAFVYRMLGNKAQAIAQFKRAVAEKPAFANNVPDDLKAAVLGSSAGAGTTSST